MVLTELNELYEHLEKEATDYHHVFSLFKNVRDKKNELKQYEEGEKAQWEMDCFNFTVNNGNIKHRYSKTNNEGALLFFPDIMKFSDMELEYIEHRFNKTTNSFLKARYAHILWESPRKHINYAKSAIDAYLDLIRIFEKRDKKDPTAHIGVDIVTFMETASFIGFKINYHTNEIRSEIKRLVKTFNLNSSSAFIMRIKLIEHMLELKKDYPLKFLTPFPKVCNDFGLRLFDKKDFHGAIDIFKTGEKVDKKLGKKTYDWYGNIAKSFEGLMNGKAETDLASIYFCQNAIEYYKKAKDRKKTKELEEKYEQLKGKQRFQKIEQEIDVTKFKKICEDYAERLCKEKPERIITSLMLDKGLLPTFKNMEKRAIKEAKISVIAQIMPMSITDQNGHTVEHFVSDDEKKHYHILRQFGWDIQLEKRILIDTIFLKIVKEGKIDIFAIIKFFKEKSWFGKTISKNIPRGKITYNWLNLIVPSLNEYFTQMQIYFSEKSYIPNFILAIDSLTLKIEGLIRDICTFSKITTFIQTKDSKSRNITMEKDINWLLHEESIKTVFDEDDLLFFKYVLIEKSGLNLRNKVAHCLMDYSEYHITHVNLLIMVLFRLGKYDFVNKITKKKNTNKRKR
ncbi:MAG: DUF4209 domain-containing protein [Spirochaetota bacterium]